MRTAVRDHGNSGRELEAIQASYRWGNLNLKPGFMVFTCAERSISIFILLIAPYLEVRLSGPHSIIIRPDNLIHHAWLLIWNCHENYPGISLVE